MHNIRPWMIASACLFVWSSLALADEAQKLPAPSAAAVNAALALVNEAYKNDLAAAQTPGQDAAMVNTLLDAAKEEKDAAAHFALLSKARDVAILANDFASASAAIDAMNGAFTVDALKMQVDTATAIAKTARTSHQRSNLAVGAMDAAAGAIVADRYDSAKTLANTALVEARACDDADLARMAAAKIQQVREAQTAYPAYKSALALLADQPNDPDANFKVGKFRCFLKADWDPGLPNLTLGNDPILKALANTELQKPTDAVAQAALGDGWWDVAQKETGTGKIQVQAHAAAWYTQAAAPSHRTKQDQDSGQAAGFGRQ